MRTAIVGCGQISALHIATLRTMEGVDLVAVCDRDEQRAREAASLWPGARSYVDFAELVRAEHPDVVHVLTPPASHATLAIQAMEAGCHVLVEKPMALSVSESERMIAAARQHGVKLCTNHNYRYKPSVTRARTLVAEGAVGRVVHVDSYYGLSDEGGDFEGPGGGHWAQRLPGGVFTNFLPHLIYLQMAFLGPVEAVSGVALGRGNGSSAPPTELSVLLQGREATGSMTFSTLAKPYAKFVDIYGTRGIIHADLVREVCTVYRQRRVPRMLAKALFNLEGSTQLALGTAVNTAKVVTGHMRNMPELPVIFGQFYESIRSDREPPAPGAEGREMVAVMEEIWRQAPSLGTPASPEIRRLPRTEVERRISDQAAFRGKVVVTGASGFLGRHLVAALWRCGVEVVAVVHDRSRASRALESQAAVVEANVCDMASLKAAMEGVSVVFHCAAATRNNLSWALHEETNIQGTRTVLEAAQAAGALRVVHVSSIVVYGLEGRRGCGLVDESTPYAASKDPWAHYLRSKLEADRTALTMYRRDGVPVTVVRPGILYGPGGRAIGQGLAQFGSLRLSIGTGDNALPFSYIDNAVDAMLLAATTEGAVGQAYNVVDEPATSVRDCARLEAQIRGERLRLVPVPPLVLTGLARALELRRQQSRTTIPPRLSRFVVSSAVCDLRYSTAKARRELGWQPGVGLEDGLRRCAALTDNEADGVRPRTVSAGRAPTPGVDGRLTAAGAR